MSHDTHTDTPGSLKMGRDSSSLHSSKRLRAGEDEAYLDNYHVHKRYLSEIMASSLNGLKVGETLSESIKASPQPFEPLESPARTETGGLSKSVSSFLSNGEELSTLDSPISDDSDDSICYRNGCFSDTTHFNPVSYADATSPDFPLKSQKVSSNGNRLLASCPILSTLFPTPYLPVACLHSKQRPTETDSRFPPSPSDPCQSADLRRAALLRSLQMRTQSPVATPIVADNCVDTCIRNADESEDLSSPGSFSLCINESTVEQAECSDAIIGSPTHGIFSGQVGRGSGRVRSLLLDECTSPVPMMISDGLSSALNTSSRKTGFSR